MIIAYPLVSLSPRPVIDTVIMIPGRSHGNLIKIRVSTNSGKSHHTTPGVTENTYPIRVNKRIFSSQLLDAVLVIRQSVIPQISIPVRGVRFIPERRTTPVSETDHDNTPLSQSRVIITIQHRKVRPHGFCLWPGVHLRHDRVFLRGIKIIRFPHDPVQIRLPVGSLHGKLFRELPPVFQQLGNIRLFQHRQQTSVTVPHGDLRDRIYPGKIINDQIPGQMNKHPVSRVFRCQQGYFLPVETDTIHECIIRITPFLFAVSIQVDLFLLRVDLHDSPGRPLARSNRVQQLPFTGIMIIMPPTGTIRPQENIFSPVHHPTTE